MKNINIIIFLFLFISPFIYIPLVVKEKRRDQKKFIWYVITGLVGLMQSLIYLMILIAIGIPL